MWSGETKTYRNKRNKLLEKEAELRALAEQVATMRRGLPQGGALKEDYEFIRARDHANVRFSELFEAGPRGSKNTLLTYSFMFRPGAKPCPMCMSLLDGLDPQIPQLRDRMSFAVFARATPMQLVEVAHSRGWRNLPLYSSGHNDFNADYRGEDADGSQLPMIHVWRNTKDGIRHFWASELFFRDKDDWTGHARHADMIWPLWNLLDLTPKGRGEDWYPQ